MIPISISTHLLVYAAIAAGVGGYIWHCQSVKQELHDTIATHRAEQVLARELNKKDVEKQKRAKETADAELKKVTGERNTLSERLRGERAKSALTPSASSTSRRPDLACFDRGELHTALSRFEERVAGLFEECDARAVELESAKRWAKQVE